MKEYRFLKSINSPYDLRRLEVADLPRVCEEVREFIVDTITQTGGHFGAGLGVIELTVALHYVYNTPIDKIIFDVGHQGYPHKILTGRRDLLHTIRKKGGLSGFLKPNESEYDVFGAGHASTSISAALGIATARDIKEENFRVVSVIGDGSMTGGLAFEAMNNCGVQKRDITVILNDNNISIDPNVSAISNYFNTLFASSTVQKMRENIWEITGKMDYFGDRIRKVASRLEGGFKAVITPGILFEAMGFNYFGPINGHNIRQLVRLFKSIKEVHGPILLHVITEKGKGYKPAEDDYHRLHAIGKIDKDTGKAIVKVSENGTPPQYYKVFGGAILEIARSNPKVVGITAAMADGTGLDIMEKEFPKRIFDVGIAEEHAVTYAAGLAIQGIIPVCAIYSSFLQRSFDQIVHDCSLQNLHVVFAIDRAGIVGEDGQTHHGLLDIAYLRIINNMILMAPKDEQELRDMLFSAIESYKGPIAIRYPRGAGLGVPLKPMKTIPLGKWERLRQGTDVALLAVGKMVNEAMKAADILKDANISAEVINARFIKPLDFDMLDEIFQNFDHIVTIEDGTVVGGFGSAVLEYLAKFQGKKPEIHLHGIQEKIVEHGTQQELLAEAMLDSVGIAQFAVNIFNLYEVITN